MFNKSMNFLRCLIEDIFFKPELSNLMAIISIVVMKIYKISSHFLYSYDWYARKTEKHKV